jgi:hypothetical protein
MDRAADERAAGGGGSQFREGRSNRHEPFLS